MIPNPNTNNGFKKMLRKKYSQNTTTTYLFYLKKYLDYLTDKKLKLEVTNIVDFLKLQKQNKVYRIYHWCCSFKLTKIINRQT